MGMHLLAGHAGSGKTERMVDRMRELLRAGEKVIYLVPEQDTVEAELFLTRRLQLQVLWNVEVLSLPRLNQRIHDEAGGSAYPALQEAGRAMALWGAVMGLRGALRYFRQGGQGASGLMGDLMIELKRAEVDPIALRLAADRLPAQGQLASKLYDLAEIYEQYETRIQGRYMDGEDALRRGAELAGHCPSLAEQTVFADGFDVLPRTSLRLLAALGAQCRQVYVAFDLCAPDAPDAALYEPVRAAHRALKEMCAQSAVPVTETALPDRPLPCAQIDHLARNLYSARPERWTGAPERVRVVKARDPYMEAERAAGYLFEKCRLNGWRYRDMAVVCADMETYGQRLEQAFARRGMRAYIDRQPSALSHPAAQYLIAALACAARYYRMDDMLRCLKTGYAGVTSVEADRLELYAMEKGLEGKLWELPILKEDAPTTGAPRSLEEVRAKFVRPLARLRKGGPARTVRAFCEAVAVLVEDAGIPGMLAQEHKRSAEEKDLTRMQVVRQVQSAINRVLDQAVELMGGEEMRMEEFLRLFRAGLSSIAIASIPMEPDAVYVGEIERFKGRGVKLLYAVGVNADRIPALKQDGGLLAESEKAALLIAAKEADVEMHLRLLSARAAIERFALYGALTSPREELVLSYASVDPRGAALRKSPLLLRIQERIFPDLREECGVMGDRYVWAGSRASMRESVSAGLRLYLGGAPLSEEFWRLYRAFRMACPQECRQMLEALEQGAQVAPLDEETARALYRNEEKQRKYAVEGMVASISQLEAFALCPFRHFLTYGIRPRELKEAQMDARDRGTLEHRAMEAFAGRLHGAQEEVDGEAAERMMEEVLTPLLEEDRSQRRDGGLVQAGHAEIRRAMRRLSRVMAMQKRLSRFRLSAQEIAFAPGDTPPLVLEGGEKVYLEGKIDRVDVLSLRDQEYARIVDYKSGNTSLGLDDVYYGLRLQLFLYLDAVLDMRHARPAGVFYQKMGEAQVRLDGAPIDGKVTEKQNKKLKLTGFILEDQDVIQEMCTDPDWMDQVLPVTPKTSKGRALPGEFTARSRERMLSEEEFTLLRRHTRRKLGELAQGVLDGRAEISPAQTAEIDACKYCGFASVCGFEEGMQGCERRKLGMPAEQAMETMRKEEEHG